MELAPGGEIKRFESISLRIGLGINATMSLLAPAAMERANIGTLKAKQMGRKVIEEAGGLEAYDRKARARLKSTDLTIEPEPNEAIVVGEG